MNKVNFEIKKMLSLLESKSGNIQPLISEQETNKPMEIPKNSLEWIKNVCLARKKSENIIDGIAEGNGTWKSGPVSGNVGDVENGDKYVKFNIGNQNYFVTAKNAKDDNGKIVDYLYVMAKQGRNTNPTTFSIGRVDCTKYATASTSLTSDSSNFTQDQLNFIRLFLNSSDAVKKTGLKWTTDKPKVADSNLLVKVDLATGQDDKGINYFGNVNMSTINEYFPEAGKYFIWANLGGETIRKDIVNVVDNFLLVNLLTRVQNDYEPTTLEDYCNTTTCPPLVKTYIKLFNQGDMIIYPMEATQIEDAKLDHPELRDTIERAQSAKSGKKVRRQANKVAEQEINPKVCRSAFETLWFCSRDNTDPGCDRYIKLNNTTKDLDLYNGVKHLKETVGKCERQRIQLTGMLGTGKSFLKTRDELLGIYKDSKFSPFNTSNSETSMNESLLNTIRDTISKHVIIENVRKRL